MSKHRSTNWSQRWDYKSKVSNRRCARSGSSHLLADVLSGESAAALSAFETSDVPLPLQSQQRLTLFDLLATAGAVYNTQEDKDRVRAAPTLLVRPLSDSSSSLPESLPDGASRSGLQDDPRRRLARLHVRRKLQGKRPQRAACGHQQPSRLFYVLELFLIVIHVHMLVLTSNMKVIIILSY